MLFISRPDTDAGYIMYFPPVSGEHLESVATSCSLPKLCPERKTIKGERKLRKTKRRRKASLFKYERFRL